MDNGSEFVSLTQAEWAEMHAVRTLNEVREIPKWWLSEYNVERPHESLKKLTPEEHRLQHYQAKFSKSA
ncbi:transposase [Lelliottia aquatilis]|nr:transposase [Lelliottia aquatilis]